MKTNTLPVTHFISEKELPYTLYSVLTSIFLLFYVPISLLPSVSDYLTTVILISGVVLMLTGILFFHRQWHFLSMVIVIIVQNFAIFWGSYRYGRSMGVMLYYFPCITAYLYVYLYNPGRLKIAIKVSIISLSFLASSFFTELKSEKYPVFTETFTERIYTINLIFSVIATLSILISLYYHFVRLHEKMITEQHKQHQTELREIDLKHERDEYLLLLSLRDDIAQTLVTSRMFLQMIPDKQELLEKADEGVKNAINGLNNISVELSPAMLIDLGFENGISVYADLLSKKFNLPIDIKLEKTSYDLPEIDRLSLFRIIRQCIEIIAVEGSATYLNISLHCGSKIRISFNHDSEVQNFAERFTQKKRQDLSKRLNYYEAVIKEQNGQVIMLLDIGCYCQEKIV